MTVMNSDYDAARRYVARLRRVYRNSILYVVILLGLFVVNALTSTQYWWVKWPALGLAVAVVVQASGLFMSESWLGKEWEQRKIKEILERGRAS